MVMNYCNDDNKKIIFVEFDTGSSKKIDRWKLCSNCNLKPKFQKHRISERRLKSKKVSRPS